MTQCLLAESITVGYGPDSYVTSESAGQLNLTIRVFSHPMTGAPRPFTLAVKTEDGTASNITTLQNGRKLIISISVHSCCGQ